MLKKKTKKKKIEPTARGKKTKSEEKKIKKLEESVKTGEPREEQVGGEKKLKPKAGVVGEKTVRAREEKKKPKAGVVGEKTVRAREEKLKPNAGVVGEERVEASVKTSDGESRTVIDRLVELIREKKRVSVDELAEIMGLERGELEQLANVLEESDIIRVKYSLLHPGRTELISKEALVPSKEEEKNLRERITLIDKDAAESEKEFFEIYDNLLKRLNRIEENLSKIEEDKTIPAETMDFLLDETSKLEDSLKSFDVRVDAFDKKLEGVRRKIAVLKSELIKARKATWTGKFLSFFERILRVLGKRKS